MHQPQGNNEKKGTVRKKNVVNKSQKVMDKSRTVGSYAWIQNLSWEILQFILMKRWNWLVNMHRETKMKTNNHEAREDVNGEYFAVGVDGLYFNDNCEDGEEDSDI